MVPVAVNVWKYTSSAKDFVSTAPEDEALFLAVLDHLGKPSVTDGILKALGDFLQSAAWKAEDDEEKPASLQELRGAGVNLQMTWLKKAGEEVPNPDGAPWQNGSVAFYVIGADTLRDLPDLLGRFVAWRTRNPQANVDRAEWPEVSELKLVIRTHEDFELHDPNLEEELGLSIELLEPERVRDVSPFCVQPPYGLLKCLATCRSSATQTCWRPGTEGPTATARALKRWASREPQGRKRRTFDCCPRIAETSASPATWISCWRCSGMQCCETPSCACVCGKTTWPLRALQSAVRWIGCVLSRACIGTCSENAAKYQDNGQQKCAFGGINM